MVDVCLICKSETKLLGEKDGYQIYRCSKCGFGFTKNLNSQSVDYHRDSTYLKEEELFKNIFSKRVKIIQKFKKGGSILEVGCSTGLMLSLFKKRGWRVTGVEISKKAAAAAKRRDLRVFTTPFEKVDLSEKFDLIVFNHTLEHLNNPREVIKKTRAVLKSDGLIYIDLPNFGSFSAKILKTRWPLLLPDEHLWHFSYLPLSMLLKEMGFKVIFDNRSSGVFDFNNPLGELWFSMTHFKKRFFSEILTALPCFIISKLKLGSDLMIIAKKR